MAGVSGVNTRTRQPASPQAINVANPLARGLVFAFDGNNWRDAVTGAVATASGTPTRISTPRGIATYFSGSAYLSFGSKELWNVTGSVTILWLGSFDATSGAFRTIVSKTANNGTADTPFDAYINSGTGVARLFRASAAAYSAQDISVGDVGAGYHALFFADDGNPNDTGTGYVDDTPYVAIAAGGATSVTGTSAALRIGRRIDDATQLTGSVNGCFIWNRRLSAEEYRLLKANPWQLFAPQRTARIYSFPTAGGGATDYPVTASDALTLADSASNVASLGAAGSDALTLADSVSNVAALSATATDALTLADSASNVAALSVTASDALTLADTLNATASGDYTATGSDALTLADSAANAAALGATGTDALTLADAASNTAALGATAADALTLADTLNASATGDYVVVATDALSLSDSVAAAYTAICIATDALSLADATSAAMAGQYAATATDALVLADAVSNAAALGVSISEALTLAVLVSALNPGQLVLGVRGRPGVQIQTGARRAQIQTGTRRN